MDVTRLVAGLHEHTTGFAEAVGGAGPETPVPTCPDWPLRVLVGHVGQSQRWAASIVRSGPSPVPDPLDADPGAPAEWSDLLHATATDLVDAVLGAGDSPVWTFFGEQQATFWLRRMLNDVVVHHADAAFTTGAAFDVAPELAADVISEWLEILSDPVTATLRPGFDELRGEGQTIQVCPDDGPGWLITRTPAGIEWSRTTGTADATLSGSMRRLLLVLTRRLPVDDATVTGDRALVEHWLAHTAA